jgi:hypothetical protein
VRVDVVSKFAWIFPAREALTGKAVKSLDLIYANLGVPDILVSDRSLRWQTMSTSGLQTSGTAGRKTQPNLRSGPSEEASSNRAGSVRPDPHDEEKAEHKRSSTYTLSTRRYCLSSKLCQRTLRWLPQQKTLPGWGHLVWPRLLLDFFYRTIVVNRWTGTQQRSRGLRPSYVPVPRVTIRVTRTTALPFLFQYAC